MNDVGDNMRADILGVRFDLIDYDRAIATIDAWRTGGSHGNVVLVNPHSVLTCHRDFRMAQAVNAASLTLPDGVGIPLAARILGYDNCGRVTGPSLMLQVCDWGRARGYRHYFYGGAEGVAEELAARLSARFPGLEVAGTYCPPFRPLSAEEDREVVERINAARPDVVWVGLGAPKQEKWMLDHADSIQATAMIGVGAAFDFHSGRVPWAPAWVRRTGLEWAYRLACEPKRMWRRNLDSPRFLLAVVAQRMRMLVRGHTGKALSACTR